MDFKMIEMKIIKVTGAGIYRCSNNSKCKFDPKYHCINSDEECYLNENTQALQIKMPAYGGWYLYEYYCEPCIDILYFKFKPFLDRNLWIMQ